VIRLEVHAMPGWLMIASYTWLLLAGRKGLLLRFNAVI
jgi:hypothetical protein